MKTVSLGIAKELKLSGFPQNTYFFWSRIKNLDSKFASELQKEWIVEHNPDYDLLSNDFFWFADPTADEILERLPEFPLEPGKGIKVLCCEKVGVFWEVGYVQKDKTLFSQEDKNLADAAAKMWIYLKSQHFL